MPEKVTFDGANKIISVNAGVTTINVSQDLYSAWKRWVFEAEGSQWVDAFRSSGGDPLSSDQTILSPAYFYLMNGWRIRINTGESVVINNNLYPDPETGAENIFIKENNSTVENKLSDAVIVNTSSQEMLAIIQRLKFNLDNDVIVTLDGEKVSTDDESREKSKADLGILL